MNLKFDPDKHIYKLDDKIIPSVTDIISELLPIKYKPGDWYLQRGRAVHQAAAFIARGVDFDYDERITGQVAAIYKFFDEVRPEVLEVEKRVYSETYRFAGTLDLYAKINNEYCLIDYKSSLSIERTGIQLAGYSIPITPPQIKGIGIEIREDGKYVMSNMLNLKNYRRIFLALRTVYAIRERLNLNKKRED